MSEPTRTCDLCGEPIEPGQALVVAEGGRTAHSGCAYQETDEAERNRWMPAEL